MKILFLTAEATPFASTGGLGDVLGSLPAALATEGLDVHVMLPLYDCISPEWRAQMTQVATFNVQLAWRNQYCGIYQLHKDGVTYYFVDNEYYFKRENIYGYGDDAERFAYFCRAALESLTPLGFVPDVIHANDWPTALATLYLKTEYSHLPTKTVYSIHNIEYQGVCGMELLDDVFDIAPRYLPKIEHNEQLNLMYAGILSCDKLTTVSNRYVEEICTPEYAHGLDKVILAHRGKMSGIVNGIDYAAFCAATSSVLTQNFTIDDMSGKAACKAQIQRLFELPTKPNVPLFVMVSRLAGHKGFDLVREIMPELLALDVQFVLLGTGECGFERYFAELAEQYPTKVGVKIAYDKDLATQIYAGGDIFLMPSRSEPCGLAQMIASRFATVPLVRETGGLADTITPYDKDSGVGNGLTFTDYCSIELLAALVRAIQLYHDKPHWQQLMRNVMATDFTWSAAARKYVGVYENVRN